MGRKGKAHFYFHVGHCIVRVRLAHVSVCDVENLDKYRRGHAGLKENTPRNSHQVVYSMASFQVYVRVCLCAIANAGAHSIHRRNICLHSHRQRRWRTIEIHFIFSCWQWNFPTERKLSAQLRSYQAHFGCCSEGTRYYYRVVAASESATAIVVYDVR